MGQSITTLFRTVMVEPIELDEDKFFKEEG